MPPSWLRDEQERMAADRILEAASKAFVERGVFRTGMREIAEAAGCSRGTLYRYFPNRQALHRAYIDFWATRLARRLQPVLAGIDEPADRIVEAVVGALRLVRETPETAAWFRPEAAGRTQRASADSAVVHAQARDFVERLLSPDLTAAGALRAAWLVRVVVSLLTLPAADAAEERALVRRFVVPGLLDAGRE